MSEYAEKHTVAKLIGSPAGYVGYEEGGLLTETIRKKPHCVLLLDEIEKAHPDIFNVLLQVMDYATLTDNQGRKADFRNVILIMTSNAGQGIKEASVGFAAENSHQEQFKNSLGQYFKPEFLNRLDDIVEFNALDKKDLIKIVDLMLANTNDMVKDQGLHIDVTPEAKELLVEKGYDPSMGARPLRRTIQEEIEDKVADYKLDNPAAKDLKANVVDGKIVISEN